MIYFYRFVEHHPTVNYPGVTRPGGTHSERGKLDRIIMYDFLSILSERRKTKREIPFSREYFILPGNGTLVVRPSLEC